ncbi:carbohydrate-binding protein [Capsulimonas corticalis]|uniref:carbohydrate-binding protein n=1 Tax=Capsulimonas corticalis TaxID=2219043 RepID=UPI000E65B2E4|nr:carbohydrate-binding protein [Capsulimonas corticalis]
MKLSTDRRIPSLSKAMTHLSVFAFIAILPPSVCANAQTWPGPTWNEFSGVNHGEEGDALDNVAYGWTRPNPARSYSEIWWGTIEATQGTWNQAVINNYGANALQWPGGSSRTLRVLDGIPSWQSNNPSVWGSDWTNYVTKVVQTLRAAPYNIQYYQIWNEAYSPASSFWPDGSWADYFNYVLNPTGQLIHQLGGKAVYGGYPSTPTSSVQEYVNQLDTYNAWGNIDVLDMHYYNAWHMDSLRKAANSRGYSKLAIWQTECGWTYDQVYVANNYPRTLYWGLSNQWNAADKYKLFYFVRDGSDNRSIYNGSTLTFHGQQLKELGLLFGGGTIAAYPGVKTSIAGLSGADPVPTNRSIETFSVGNNIIAAVHLAPADYNNNANVTLTFPFPLSQVTTAERVDLTGNRVNLTATGGAATTSVTVATHDASGSSALSWNGGAVSNSEPSTFYVVLTTAGARQANVPYSGGAAAIPGVFDACNYNTGGQNVGYNVASVNGTANSYRPDGVDLETTSDAAGGYDIGWAAAGQWFKYTVNVATAGTYAVTFRVAAPSAVTNAFHLTSSAGSAATGEVSIPASGGYQNWTTVTANITLAAGSQALTLTQDNPGWNFRWMGFGPNKAPFGGTPAAVPGVVEAENYDTGGQGIAYNQTVNGGQTAYRADNNSAVGADASASNGYCVGSSNAGQWLRYTVNVASGGAYTLGFRASSGATGGRFHLQDERGNNLTGTVNIPSTGGWSTYTTVSVSGVNLTPGLHVFTLMEDTSGFNIDSITFTAPLPIGHRIALYSPTAGYYVSTDQTDSTYLKASLAASPSTWEYFDVRDAGSGNIALLSEQTGKYVSVDMNQSSRVLRADLGTTIGAWEPFKWVSLGGSNVALQATIDSDYVSYNPNDVKRLEAQWATSPGDWETFSWMDLGLH